MGNYYRDRKVKKLKVRNRLISILLAASIGTGAYFLVDSLYSKANEIHQTTIDNSELPDYQFPIFGEDIVQTEVQATPMPTAIPTPVPTPEISPVPAYGVDDGFNRGDSVVATTDVNLRINNNVDSYRIGTLPQGSVVNRILSRDNWDLVRYGDTIAYVSSDYTQNCDTDYNNEYYRVEDYSDIVRTTTNVYFRLGPSTSEKDMCLLDTNEELVVLGKAIVNGDPNNLWYVARARGKIGFVKAEYTRSLRDILAQSIPDLGNVKVQKLGYLTNTAPIYDASWNVSTNGDTYQLVQILQEFDSYYLVNMDGRVGYVSKDAVRTIQGSFLVVDISDQRVSYYCNTDVAFQSTCTTGKRETPTHTGFFEPYGKASSHNFGPNHNNVEAKILWMPFNGGEGFHDAPWESAGNFGSYDYAMNHGSAGCVRLPDEAASFLYNNVPQSTKVLVKQ